jgi:hypothetical protein
VLNSGDQALSSDENISLASMTFDIFNGFLESKDSSYEFLNLCSRSLKFHYGLFTPIEPSSDFEFFKSDIFLIRSN